jgi:hypothetical protein
MSKPPRRRPNYDRKLGRRSSSPTTQPFALRDTANLFTERFTTVREWRTFEIACLLGE